MLSSERRLDKQLAGAPTCRAFVLAPSCFHRLPLTTRLVTPGSCDPGSKGSGIASAHLCKLGPSGICVFRAKEFGPLQGLDALIPRSAGKSYKSLSPKPTNDHRKWKPGISHLRTSGHACELSGQGSVWPDGTSRIRDDKGTMTID